MWLSKVFVFAVFLTIATAQDDSILQTAAKFLGSCGDKNIMLCLKERALKAIEVATDGNVEIAEGVTLVKDESAVETAVTTEEVLPEEGRAREDAIEDRIADRIANFITSYKLEFKLPKETAEQMNRSMDEARRRKKRGLKKLQRLLLPLLLLLQIKSGLLFPLMIGGVALLAFKAFITAKIALILALVSAVKKLLTKFKGHDSLDIFPVHAPIHGHSHGGWEGEEHHHDYHSGPYRRAITAQDMAYNAYATHNQQ